MDILSRLKVLFPDIDDMNDVLIQDDSDGKGPYIKKWNRPEPQPTVVEINAVTQAQIDASQWQGKREVRYKAEANPALIKALSIAQQDSLPIDYTEHDAIVAGIKTDIPKAI